MTWTAFAIFVMFSCSKRTYGTDSWFIIQSDWRGNVRASDQITSVVFLEYNLQQKTFFIFFSLSWHCVHTVHVLVCCTSLSDAKTWRTLSSFVLIIPRMQIWMGALDSAMQLVGKCALGLSSESLSPLTLSASARLENIISCNDFYNWEYLFLQTRCLATSGAL